MKLIEALLKPGESEDTKARMKCISSLRPFLTEYFPKAEVAPVARPRLELQLVGKPANVSCIELRVRYFRFGSWWSAFLMFYSDGQICVNQHTMNAHQLANFRNRLSMMLVSEYCADES